MTKVAEGLIVSLEYTLKNDEGEEIENNIGKEPLTYIHGQGQIVPGLENEVEGMKVGDSKEVVVKPEEGYGEIDEEGFIQIPVVEIPEEARQVGTRLQMSGDDGSVLYPIISAIEDEVVILDFNHPLAGKTLHFSFKVTDVQEK